MEIIQNLYEKKLLTYPRTDAKVLSTAIAKEITKTIKEAKLKVSASIQGDQLRVSSKSKDELQAVIALLKGKDFGVELQFTNYR